MEDGGGIFQNCYLPLLQLLIMDISIETPQQRFDEHLKLPNNNRILFSGKFGTGKSYFLREYFKQNADKYNLFWISPVDYVVGANQDIFEWIKIDIAKQLLEKYLIDEVQETFSENLQMSTYALNNAGTIFTKLALKLSSKGIEKVTGFDLEKELELFISDYQKFQKEIEEKTKSTFKKLSEYINAETQIKGSIYEDDLKTQLIRLSLQLISTSSQKENIIVIDDLDRLDPEHIFRILNILSAHNKHFDSNKFEFNRVIAVCDINNIQHLFEYRYGEHADFEGYIEKYFTYEPFIFEISDTIRIFCQNAVVVQSLGKCGRSFLALVLAKLVEKNRLKVRNLIKIYNTIKVSRRNLPSLSIPIQDRFIHNYFIATDIVEIYPDQYEIVDIIKILVLAIGGTKLFMSALDAISDNAPINNESELETVVEILCIPHHIVVHKNNPQNICAVFSGNDWQYNMGWPQTRLLNLSFNLSLKWTKGQKYSGGDYFQEFEGSYYRSFQFAASQLNLTATWTHISNDIKEIMSYLESHSIV